MGDLREHLQGELERQDGERTELTTGVIGKQLDQFNPDRYRLVDRALDFTIEEAKRLQDWPLLEDAVDTKIGEQMKFVAWWKVNVAHGGGSKNRDRGSYSLGDAEDLTGMKQQRVSDLAKLLADLDSYRERLLGAAYIAACLDAPHTRGTLGTGKNEWFTPQEYIELARAVLGEIDLDPATHELAQELIRATNYYTKEVDGLMQEWNGRIWLNPPFAQPLIANFISKLCAEWQAGRITAAIALTHNYTDTAWFHEMAQHASAVCFTRGRVKFYEGDTVAAPTQGQAFCYFGPDVEQFAKIFSRVGFVVVPRR
jgi:ParB family chromosome partitioning protein